MQNSIHISSNHLQIVKNILKKNGFTDDTIWIFGSRVSNNHKPYSDLDIAIQNSSDESIILKKMASVKADFIESDLPYKVDVLDYNSVSGIFRKNVDANKVMLIID